MFVGKLKNCQTFTYLYNLQKISIERICNVHNIAAVDTFVGNIPITLSTALTSFSPIIYIKKKNFMFFKIWDTSLCRRER